MDDKQSYMERARATGATDDVIAGLDILVDDGMPVEEAVSLVVTAHRRGKDAESFARHVVRLRQVLAQG